MKDNLPLISVIIPVYKVESYLDRCVESVVSQTYRQLEIILVDDGSPDRCPQMCDAWAEKDGRIKVIHKVNGGLSDARNAALRVFTGEYVTFVDSDDYLRSDAIEVLHRRILQDAAELAICNYRRFSDNSDEHWDNTFPLKDEVLTVDEAQRHLCDNYHWHYVIACCKLYQRRLFDGFSFPVGKLHEDVYTAHLLFDKCTRISSLSDALYYYYQNSESITGSSTERHLEIVDAYIERFWFYYERRNYYCAAMNMTMMIKKVIEAQANNPSPSTETVQKFKAYKKSYRAMLKKILKHIDKSMPVSKSEFIAYAVGNVPFRAVRYLHRLCGYEIAYR